MRYTILLLILIFQIQLFGQKSYPQDAFRSPVDFPIYLSGTFAELRSNHFHSGIDIKTEGVIKKKIYAVADGYVSRIKISPYGFGKAIYIRHPNGYTTVYAHLNEFQGDLVDIVKKEHYRRKSFSMDYFPEAGTIKVTKGEVIALSGNSGGSAGPHLHFEIRDTRTEHPLNPLLFGFKIQDNIKPTLKGFYVYDFHNGMTTKRTDLSLSNVGSNYKLANHDTLEVSPEFYFGINAIDKLDGFPNQNGLYTLEVYSDDQLVFKFKAEEFSFSRTRYLNSYIDYERYKQYSERIQRTYVEPNNKLQVYGANVNNGLFNLNENETRNIKIKATDIKGNERIIQFVVRQSKPAIVKEKKIGDVLFKWDQANTYKADGLEFYLPAKVLYKDIYFNASVSKEKANAYSKTYRLHTDFEPLQTYCTLKIKPSVQIPAKAKPKACIVSISSKGILYYEGGTWEGDYLKCKTRSFGTYYISADSVPPTITPINIFNGKSIASNKTIKIKISDNLSGIKAYNAYVDGKWILLDYDAKNNLLEYQIDEHFPVGKHEFKIVVTDARGNQSVEKYQLTK